MADLLLKVEPTSGLLPESYSMAHKPPKEAAFWNATYLAEKKNLV